MFKKLSWRYLVLKIFFKISFLKKKICDFYSTRLVDHFGTKQVIICDKISILDFAYVSYLNLFYALTLIIIHNSIYLL